MSSHVNREHKTAVVASLAALYGTAEADILFLLLVLVIEDQRKMKRFGKPGDV